jgi:hypothetical protein
MDVFIEVVDLRVRSLDLDFHEVSWKLADTSNDVLDYTFQVLRSESPEGPFDTLTPPMDDTYLFIDNILQVANRWRKYFYKIRVTRKASGDEQDFGPVAKDPEPDLIAQELRRHMGLLFQEFAGRSCWILPARTFGQRCECWNARLRKRTRSGCLTCYDTGWVRGYMSPIETYMQIDPSVKANQDMNVAKTQQVNTTARFGYYPPIKPMDLIIEPENRRWKVVTSTGTEQGRAIVHQELQIHEVPLKDIEFRVPLHLKHALKDLWLNPARNYTNPQNLEAFMDESLGDIFNLYPDPNKKTV